MKSEIFRTAWQFFKQTGMAFGECLRKAWQLAKLKNRMQHEIVKFYFQKVDGSIREAYGTLRADLMPATTGDDSRKKNDTVQVYFDTEVQNFRCFKKLNLIQL